MSLRLYWAFKQQMSIYTCVLQVVELSCCSLVQSPVVNPRVEADCVAVLLQACTDKQTKNQHFALELNLEFSIFIWCCCFFTRHIDEYWQYEYTKTFSTYKWNETITCFLLNACLMDIFQNVFLFLSSVTFIINAIVCASKEQVNKFNDRVAQKAGDIFLSTDSAGTLCQRFVVYWADLLFLQLFKCVTAGVNLRCGVQTFPDSVKRQQDSCQGVQRKL